MSANADMQHDGADRIPDGAPIYLLSGNTLLHFHQTICMFAELRMPLLLG